MTSPTPAVGRIAHFQTHGTADGAFVSEARAAIISDLPEVGDGIVGLTVFHPTGVFFKGDVPYAETPTPGHWSWPPRT